MASTVFAASPEFEAKGLEQRVDFWKKIFTQYGKDDVVIHDIFYVNLVYDVAADSDVRSKSAAVRDTLREIRSNLSAPASWSPAARAIGEAMQAQSIAPTVQTMDALIDGVHTQRGIKERFRDGIVRSGRHVEEFRGILRTAGIPEDLALLPLVESSFENVRSKAGAMGMWQFTRGTGKLYLKINSKVDERLDPVKATNAAARLLRDNYNALGSWPLAVTAYNHGQAGMKRAKQQIGSELTSIIDNYRGPVFGYASMNFYSEFLAAVEVYESYPTYFAGLVLDQPATPVRVAAATAAPKPSSGPQMKAASASNSKYKVRRGDTLSELAQRFGTTIRSLMEVNNLSHPAIYAGQILLVK